MKEFLYNSSEFQILQTDINKMISVLDSDFIISQEGLGNVIKKVLTSVVDRIMLHIGTIFKNSISLFNIAGVLNSFIVNSPVEDFFSKNRTKTLFLFNEKNYVNYMKIYIPKPRSMVGSYSNVYETHKQIMKSLNMIPFIKATNNDLQLLIDILSNTSSTQDITTKKIADIVKNSTVNEKTLHTLAKEHDKQFSGDANKESKVLYPNEFKNVKDFKLYCEDIVDLFSQMKNIKKINDDYSAQSLLIRKVIDKVETSEKLINKESIKYLIAYFQYIATCYQLFGTMAVSQLAIENNLVITLNEMLSMN